MFMPNTGSSSETLDATDTYPKLGRMLQLYNFIKKLLNRTVLRFNIQSFTNTC